MVCLEKILYLEISQDAGYEGHPLVRHAFGYVENDGVDKWNSLYRRVYKADPKLVYRVIEALGFFVVTCVYDLRCTLSPHPCY